MIVKITGGARGDAVADEWAAELAIAAYFVALRHSATRRWLELQLELWRALSATLDKHEIVLSPQREATANSLHADDFLAEVASVAYQIALPYGCRRSFLDLELELFQSLRSTLEKMEQGVLVRSPTNGG